MGCVTTKIEGDTNDATTLFRMNLSGLGHVTIFIVACSLLCAV